MKEVSAVPILRGEALKESLTEAEFGAAARLLKEAPPKIIVWFAIAGCLVPLSYALYTNHIWEDFFITFRHSQRKRTRVAEISSYAFVS